MVMQLGEKHFKAIEYIIKGENLSNVARITGVSRTALYNWLEEEEFKAELNRQRQEIKDSAKERINANIGIYIAQLHEIATTSQSEKARIEASTYLLNRVLGTPTRVQQDITREDTKENNNIDIDSVLEEMELKEAK